MKYFIFLASILMGVSSVAGTLKIRMSDKGILLPIAQQSCEDVANGDPTVKSLLPNSVVFSGLGFSWNGNSNLEIQAVYVTLVGKELKTSPMKFQLGFVTNPILPGTPSESESSEYYSACGIRLGSIELKPGVQEATIEGNIVFLGTETFSDGHAELNQTTTPITLYFRAN